MAREGLVSLVEEHVDFDALLDIAAGAQVPACDSAGGAATQQLLARLRSNPAAGPAVRIGVARDAAFALYYSE